MCEWVPEPEDSSPVLTWILGYFWSLPSRLSPRLDWGHARVISSRAVAAVSRFPSGGSRDLCLSLEAFPRGFPTGLSHVSPWCESILRLKVEAVQGKQVSLEWTETSRGLWEWGLRLEFRRVLFRSDQGICVFPSRLSHEAFPQGCPTCHRDVSGSSD